MGYQAATNDAKLCFFSQARVRSSEGAAAVEEGRAAPSSTNAEAGVSRGLLGSGDEDDIHFMQAVKGLVSSAIKLMGVDQGFGAWLVSGVMRNSGMVDVSLW